MTSRTKKRIVLPSRPEPPSIEQILQDIHEAVASDPVFNCDFNDESLVSTHDVSSEREKQYRQSCSYMEMNNNLKEVLVQLKEKCNVLGCTGKTLEQDIDKLREAAM